MFVFNHFFYRLLFYFYVYIERHIGGTCHNCACTLDQAEPASSWIISSSHQVITQPKITTSIQQSSEEAYLKMLQIAYTLGLEPTLPS